jgi:hypothetical protein
MTTPRVLAKINELPALSADFSGIEPAFRCAVQIAKDNRTLLSIFYTARTVSSG